MIAYLVQTVEPEVRIRRAQAVQAQDFWMKCHAFPDVWQVLVPEYPYQPLLDNPSNRVIGAWAQDGTTLELDEALYEQLRPLGNDPSGHATQHLLYPVVMGHQVKAVGTGDDEITSWYPDGSQPFAIEVRHKEFTEYPDPGHNGHGWRAEILGGAASRDPSVRAMAVYSDPECTAYLYTTGAFQQGLSDWQVDDEGEPLSVWFSETPAGRNTAEPADWHMAVLFASLQEGYATLGADDDRIQWLYWDKVQGGSGNWVDSGSTVTGIVGAGTYNVDDSTPFDSYATGAPMRFGDDFETLFDRVHSNGIIVVADHDADAVGKSIWSQPA